MANLRPAAFPGAQTSDASNHGHSPAAASTSGQTGLPRVPDSASVDPDTCRICRGEGTSNEPLYYPCKCSGSIRYVHQDCLLEWLTHSQKKHCELCKTPFRFTKLYSPHMPNTLPVHIFIGHVTKYLFRNAMVWLRAILVAVVWLCWLPWLMRTVWSFLFWISDDGLGSSSFWGFGGAARSSSGMSSLTQAAHDAQVCPSNPFLWPTMHEGDAAQTLEGFFRNSSSAPFSGSWRGVNISTNDTVSSALLRATITYLASATGRPALSSATCPADLAAASSEPSSLLSGVSFLKNLSRYPYVNYNVIKILEGQIITILVVVCFILVILVRDYVVQQQPELNMRAAFDQENEEPPNHQQQDDEVHQDQAAPMHFPGPDANQPVEADRNGDAAGEASGYRAASTSDVFDDRAEDPWIDEIQDPVEAEPGPAGRLAASRRRLFAYSDLPDNEDDNQLHGQPRLAESASMQDVLRIYRETGGDRERFKQALGLDDDPARLALLLRMFSDQNVNGSSSGTTNSTDTSPFRNLESATRSGQLLEHFPSSASPRVNGVESQAGPADLDGREEGDRKGKGKAVDGFFQENSSISSEESQDIRGTDARDPLRPRAASDGPQPNAAANPLANNNWTFEGIREQPQQQEISGHERTVSSTTATGSVVDDFAQPSDSAGAGAGVPDVDGVRIEDHLSRNDAEHPAGHPAEEARPNAPQVPGLMEWLTDFMWGGIEEPPVVVDLAMDLEFPPDHEEESDNEDNAHDIPEAILEDDVEERDPEVVQAAVAAGLDPEAIDDAEDIDGVLELLGMRGPLVGLFQNAVFCAVLVSVTIFVCVFVPYNVGRLSIWSAMNPMCLVDVLFGFTKFIQDVAIAVAAMLGSGFLTLMYYVGNALNMWLPSARYNCGALSAHLWRISTDALIRVFETLNNNPPLPSSVDIQAFSAVSHQSLNLLKAHFVGLFVTIGNAGNILFSEGLLDKCTEFVRWSAIHAGAGISALRNLPSALLDPSTWVISFGGSRAPAMIPEALVHWSGGDRFLAILFGYFTLSAVGALYLRRGAPFSSGQVAQEWEASLIDILSQAGGVMKVILIISIEMLVFPLYCGMLLDFALLPLFENANVLTRLTFTMNSPVTSVFMHWFVGTGYMFHFALFVSMCRKIMRKGVLYFIRDPDDPEFHPVRDVLERNLVTQLRKIAFSAFVYGALIIICLGGVVWGLALAISNVLPIHYSSNEPVLEFPIDLLFYNFAMPLAVRFFKPSDGLHSMYTWWLRRCARFLRLTWFLFGDRRIDEEGELALAEDSPDRELPHWKRYFLERDGNTVIPKTWADTIENGTKPEDAVESLKVDLLNSNGQKNQLVESGQLIPDGTFVRTPASDQVRIPKGKRTFLEVTQDDVDDISNRRAEGPDDLYMSNQYQTVYLPPHFKMRLFMFIMFIWIFAAVTGVSFTIIPLIFGRMMFRMMIPAHIRTNDVYAFSIGVHVLGSIVYMGFHARSLLAKLRTRVNEAAAALSDSDAPRKVGSIVLQVAKIVYTYTMLLIVFPIILTLLMELYVVIPLHTHINPPSPYIIPAGTTADINSGAVVPSNNHTIRVVQSWTLGLLYVKLCHRLIRAYGSPRLVLASETIARHGWLRPNVSVLTRAFVLPAVVLGGLAILAPPCATYLFEKNGLLVLSSSALPSPHERAWAYRMSYPYAAISTLLSVVFWSAISVISSWRTRIRDEAYLIGERLHNFGVATAGSSAGATPWRVQGA